MERNNKWLVLANPKFCRHTDCLHKEKFVSWVQKSYPFEIGDIVYLYINGAVHFKTFVEVAVPHREDSDYWIGKAPEHPTFRLRLVKESDGNGLTAEDLARFGFKGGQSLRHYIHHNTKLLEYIESIFE
ncbi:MAG: hypothetical protein J6X07_10200 [Prevotella sp.]|nr:hypothetical protein [Prevotella sp.]